MTRRPRALRTADVLAQYPADGSPRRSREVASALGVASTAISGHLTHLHRTGKLRRVDRGVYEITDWGLRSHPAVAGVASVRRKKRAKTSDPKSRRAQLERDADARQQFLTRHGYRTDRLGNLANAVRREKKAIRRELGLSTGRSWRRWLKASQRAERRAGGAS